MQLIRLGKFFFRYRNVLFPIVFVGLAALSTPEFPAGSARLDRVLDGIGIALALLGQSIRVVVIGLAYIKRGGKDKNVYADRLVQEGIFAHCRNPLYVGNILIQIGLMVVYNGLWVYVIGVPFVLLTYLSIVATEENYLREKFGAVYEDYCRRVPRFRFRLSGLDETFRNSRFNWKKVIGKEYGTPFAWITAVLAVLIWEDTVHLGFKPTGALFIGSAAVWLACLSAYVAARILKKTGRLRSSGT